MDKKVDENSDDKKVRYYNIDPNEKNTRDKRFYLKIALIVGVAIAIPLLLLGTCFAMFAVGF